MKIEIDIDGRKSIIRIDGVVNEVKTVFLKQMYLNDIILYYKDEHKNFQYAKIQKKH